MGFGNGLVLADDATGALECASLLAGMKLAVSISLSGAAGPGIGVVDTESRHLLPEQACVRMRYWLELFGTYEGTQVFKKTDSTLRGNIAAELVAMLRASDSRQIVYVPAYPALGRTVQAGRLLVHGVPVAETEFAADARQPVRTSQVADLFPQAVRHLITHIADAEALAAALRDFHARVLICDASSDGDLLRLAGAIQKAPFQPWVASPAGFIKAWASLGAYPRAVSIPIPHPRKWLVVCGSLHRQSRRQASIAEALGMNVIQSRTDTSEPPELVAVELAGRTVSFIAKDKTEAVLIMGGDTVWAVWRAMGLDALIPLPEVLPGIGACLTPDRQLLFVTKAGGFGEDRLVERVLERFK